MEWHAFAVAIGAVIVALIIWDLFIAGIFGLGQA